ncbi:hypothetical protein [Alkalihalobacterium elongatum]|uniref:hypothetical protein n=1 Tax=Alkalihalobacterium elongatum TaxID=2675466 RepID=UPI001C1F799F|nr:hypothetical protein [Alkalihalobacterium elongatum]
MEFIHKSTFTIPIVLIISLSLCSLSVSAEEPHLLSRPKAVTFIGETQDWYIEHQMKLIGTDLNYNTKLNYKGNDTKILNTSPLYYQIVDKKGGTHGSCFNLNNEKLFQSKNISCGGCHYLDQESEVTCVIHLPNIDKEEVVILKRK